MKFDFTDDQHEIKRTARDLLASRAPVEKHRESAENGAYDLALWNEISELGWPGVALPEDSGGGGLGYVELASLLEESGYALLNSPLLSSAMCAAAVCETGSPEQKERWLGPLARGEATGAFGVESELVADAAEADVVVLVNGSSAAARLYSGSDFSSVKTIDPGRRYSRPRPAEGTGEKMPGDATSAVDIASVLVSAELVGICSRVLEMTVEYVKERRQFGRPVGSFQAVQHRCASMLLLTEGTRAVTYFAAWSADADRSRLAEASSLAKSASSRAGVEVTGSAIQAHGGIGFTWEADIHWFFKRAQLSSAFLGASSSHNRRLIKLFTDRD